MRSLPFKRMVHGTPPGCYGTVASSGWLVIWWVLNCGVRDHLLVTQARLPSSFDKGKTP